MNRYIDNSTHINYPSTIDVHEHKAPTDASIKLMEEAHDKAIKNIIAKVKVVDNLVNGECYAIEQPWNMHEIKLVFKFSINGHEFNVEKEIERSELWNMETEKDINMFNQKVKNYAKSVMLWYAVKMLSVVLYEKIADEKVPSYILKNL